MAEPTWCAIQKLVGIEPQASGSGRFDALHLLGTSTGSTGQTNIDSDLSAMRAAAGSD